MKKTRLFISLFMLICVLAFIPKLTCHAENKVKQAGVSSKTVDITWTVPEQAQNEEILWYKLKWTVNGKEHTKTISGKASDLSYTIKGLEASSTYKVTVTYKYISSDGAAHTNTLGSVKAKTTPKDSKMKMRSWYCSTTDIRYKMEVPKGKYQYFSSPISQAKPERWIIQKVKYSKTSYIESTNFTGPLDREGAYEFWIRPYIALKSDGDKEDIVGPWKKIRIVPDPDVEIISRKNYVQASIEPLKGARSYDVYVGKFTGTSYENTMVPVVKGKNFEKVGTYHAQSKPVKVYIKKYKNKSITKYKDTLVLRVVTNSKYGSSKGNCLRRFKYIY